MAADVKSAPTKQPQFVWTGRTDAANFSILSTIVSKRKPILCNNVNLDEYVDQIALPTADWIVVGMDPSAAAGDRLRGFALLAKRPVDAKTQATAMDMRTGGVTIEPVFRTAGQPHVLLDVICAVPGTGTAMLLFVDQLTVRLGFGLVELHALPNVINYYRKQGYVNARPGDCQENPKITAAASDVGQLKFETIPAALKNKTYTAFLQTLIDDGTAVNPACRGTGRAKTGCSYDGYLMTRCLPTTLTRAPSNAAASTATTTTRAPSTGSAATAATAAAAAATAAAAPVTRSKTLGKGALLKPSAYFTY